MTANTITLYTKDQTLTLPFLDAVKRLKQAPFGVFLSFVDPRSGSYIQKLFPFFYKPHQTFGISGICFVSEWLGMPLYVPADIAWLTDDSHTRKSVRERKIYPQIHSVLTGGEYISHTITVEVGYAVRVDVSFDEEFSDLLNLSGHQHLVTVGAS